MRARARAALTNARAPPPHPCARTPLLRRRCDLYPSNGDRPKTWGGSDYAKEAGAVMAALERSAGVPAGRFQGATFCCGHFDGVIPDYIDANRASLRSISFHE